MSTQWLALTNHTGFHLDDLQVRNSYWRTEATQPNTHTYTKHTLPFFPGIVIPEAWAYVLKMSNKDLIKSRMNSGSSETIWKREECFHTAHSLHHHHYSCLCVGSLCLLKLLTALMSNPSEPVTQNILGGLLCNKNEKKERSEVLIIADSNKIQSRNELFFLFLCLSEIIDDLAHLVDNTDDRIRNETRRVKLVETKSASCGEPSLFFFTVEHLGLISGTKAGLISELCPWKQITINLFIYTNDYQASGFSPSCSSQSRCLTEFL